MRWVAVKPSGFRRHVRASWHLELASVPQDPRSSGVQDVVEYETTLSYSSPSVGRQSVHTENPSFVTLECLRPELHEQFLLESEELWGS
jgi:hypothetical protein